MRRERLGFIFLLLTVWLTLPPMATSAPAEPAGRGQVEFFEKQIRPLLAQHCFECHGPEKQESDLRLDSRTSILEGGLSGSAIVVGKPEKSLLIEAIGYEGDIEMPPDGPLQAADVAKLTKWVQTGALWPADAKSQPIRRKGLSDKDRNFWSFQPVKNPVLPKVKETVWLKTPVDSFVLARLEKAGLSPAPSADRRKLIRRATFDLTGLPPTPEEVKEFLSDERVDAYPRLIERLISSPAYGQRWGRHWLDLVRYCDSRDARHVGQPYDINEIWRYRDWVVKAMNEDMPYDRFVASQIAGDCLKTNESSAAEFDGLVASGMLVIGEWGSGDADAKKMLTDIVDDQINVVSQAFLGLSITCARCHDHKYDPISTADYYALAGIFFSTQIATPRTDAPLMRRPLASEGEVQHLKKHQAQVTAQEQKIKQTTEQHAAATSVPAAEKTHLKEMKTELASLKKNSPPPIPVALSAQEGGVPGTTHAGFKDARIHLRGQYNRLGAVVPRGFPKVLAGDKRPPITKGSGRRELAEWIASENNPLTARVMVNRIWLHHFGEGIVRTPGDFGIQGERPTHPALLDYLAYQFVESGWSIKTMHRMMMLSATYRQSTQGAIATLRADPGNHLLGRMNIRRLESEAIRDTLLSVSGRLDRSMGGPSATRYPGGYSRATLNKADYSSRRRALYVMTIRAEKTGGPFVLDAADPDRIVHHRTVSTKPWSSGAANLAAHRPPKEPMAANTIRLALRCGWPAAV